MTDLDSDYTTTNTSTLEEYKVYTLTRARVAVSANFPLVGWGGGKMTRPNYKKNCEE